MMRSFVAVEISNKNVVDSIASFQSKLHLKAKPVESQNFHFTLQFLGEVSDIVIEKIKEALRTVEFLPFIVNFKGIGAFPKMKFPKVIWIGTDELGGRMLVELAKKVENVLLPIGFRCDKPFKSHITIFRIKNKIGDITKELEPYRSIDFGSQEITNFKLKQSVLTPHGPIYSDLEEIKAKR